MSNPTTFADDLREMLAAWNTIERTARQQFPNANDDEIERITRGAMDHALSLETKGSK